MYVASPRRGPSSKSVRCSSDPPGADRRKAPHTRGYTHTKQDKYGPHGRSNPLHGSPAHIFPGMTVLEADRHSNQRGEYQGHLNRAFDTPITIKDDAPSQQDNEDNGGNQGIQERWWFDFFQLYLFVRDQIFSSNSRKRLLRIGLLVHRSHGYDRNIRELKISLRSA